MSRGDPAGGSRGGSPDRPRKASTWSRNQIHHRITFLGSRCVHSRTTFLDNRVSSEFFIQVDWNGRARLLQEKRGQGRPYRRALRRLPRPPAESECLEGKSSPPNNIFWFRSLITLFVKSTTSLKPRYMLEYSVVSTYSRG